MRTVRVWGASLSGIGAELVTVEAHFEVRDTERTEVQIAGLPDPVIRESRGRLLCALAENRLGLPRGRLFLNLVPAARPKAGAMLDLPLALAAVAAAGHLAPKALEGVLFLGEVGIDGTLYGVPGGLAAALAARERGLGRLIAPPATAEEAACIPELEVWRAEHLARVLAHLTHAEPVLVRAAPFPAESAPIPGPGLDEVVGQAAAKEALAVAAAGRHGLLLVGPPGAGKSMLAARLPRLLPPPDLEERLEITRVLSAAGRWPKGLARRRPFRAPHHSVSSAGLVGGGPQLSPGEVTLAHGGVLFLDELPEFQRDALEALREPLETGRMALSRARGRVELPASFLLVAAMNPCPCGYHGHPRIACVCSGSRVERYLRRLSGPLVDRIELRVELPPAPIAELVAASGAPLGPREEDLARRVREARARQVERGQEVANSELAGAALDAVAALDAPSRQLLRRAAEHYGLSARAVQSARRVARTLADLSGAAEVAAPHLAQALALRSSFLDARVLEARPRPGL